MTKLFATSAAFTASYDLGGGAAIQVSINNWGKCSDYMTDLHLPWTWRKKTTDAVTTALRWDAPKFDGWR